MKWPVWKQFTWRRASKVLVIVLFVGLVSGALIYAISANREYTVNEGFVPVQLNYDPYANASSFDYRGARVTVTGGFVKGLQTDEQQRQWLVVRALAPLPAISVGAGNSPDAQMLIRLENVNPDFYIGQVAAGGQPQRLDIQTVGWSLALAPGGSLTIQPTPPADADAGRYVILGDSRDGYDTFTRMIEQINELKPVFIVDNGDLVYAGKPNQYRLFDRMAASLNTTLCTTLGNHDIRFGGRPIYTMLYGPPYYSFDYGSQHFAFLDSSPGWTGSPAISPEQYTWLEQDLKKSQNKRIFIISHIPPHDPRKGQPLESTDQALGGSQKSNVLEAALNRLNENVMLNHGFHDAQEADRFEAMMSRYKVDTVYLSHIHSFAEYDTGGVRYLISGGAGAELLLKNSYYHYLIVKMNNSQSIILNQMPSPANQYTARYAAAAALFAKALYLENRLAAILFLSGLAALAILILAGFLTWIHRRVTR